MKSLIFASFMMFALMFCSCNSAEKNRAAALSNYAGDLRSANERIAFRMSSIAKKDSILLELKCKISNPKLSVKDKEGYIYQYGAESEAKGHLLPGLDELETWKSRLQRGVSALNPTADEKTAYGLQNYLE